MDIRSASEDDATAVRAVITEAFAGEGPAVAAIWHDVVAAGHDRASLVAVDRDAGEAGVAGVAGVVGHVGLSHAWLDARERLLDVLVLSPLSVLPGRQREGIGSALLASALEAADALGAPAVFLEGSPDYYGARGFGSASERGFAAPSARIPGPAFQVALGASYEGWMSGRVVYRDLWWEHDATGLRDPLLAELERSLGDGG